MQRQSGGNCISKNRLPIMPTILRKISGHWADRATEYDIIMLRAAACMVFFSFFRLGEILVPPGEAYNPTNHLSVGDVAVDNMTHSRLIHKSA